MIRVLLLSVLAAGCLTGPAARPEAIMTRPEPGLESVSTRPLAGYFPVPERLAVDPTALPTPPLQVKVARPEQLVLANGVVVSWVEDHTTPLVLVRALLPLGGADEPGDRVGLAALVATLLVEGGTTGLKPEALDELLEMHAVDASAIAGDEYTTVTWSLRSGDLTKLFPLFADTLQRPRFDRQRFEIVRARMQESALRRDDRPDAVASRAVTKAVFGPSSPLAREPLRRTLEATSLDDVRRLYAQRVTPRGTRVVITGDFDPAVVKTLLELHLARWPDRDVAPRQWPSPPVLERRVVLVPREVAQVKVRVGGVGFTRTSPEEPAVRLASSVLGSFGVGRLPRELRDARSLAYSAFASVSPGPTTGMFLAGFDTRPDQLLEALEVTLRLLERAGREAPVTAEELAVAQDMATHAFAFRFDTAARIGLERALLEQFGYPDDYLDRYADRIRAVTLDEVNRAAQDLGERLQIVVVGPQSLEASLSTFGPVTVISDVDEFR